MALPWRPTGLDKEAAALDATDEVVAAQTQTLAELRARAHEIRVRAAGDRARATRDREQAAYGLAGATQRVAVAPKSRLTKTCQKSLLVRKPLC